MKLPFWEPGKPAGAILGTTLDDVVNELCDRKQMVLLATPYVHFPSRFLERNGAELTIRAAMSRDAIRHTLSQHPLRLRFAWALSFYSGPTRILGYEQEEHRRHLKVAMPDHLVIDERRRTFRVDRTGHSTGAIGALDGTILRISLDNLSTLGAGVFSLEPIPADSFQTGRPLDLSLSLDQGFVLMCQARVCQSEGQSLGLAFHPPLAGQTLQRLSEWLAPRVEEARQRWENRTELRARAELLAKPKTAPAGALLISTDPAFTSDVAAALGENFPLRSVIPVMAPFKEVLSDPPLLLLVDARALGMEERYRIRMILEAAPVNAPLVIVGSVDDPFSGRLLARELRNPTYLDWNPQQGTGFRTLAEALVQRFWKPDLLPPV